MEKGEQRGVCFSLLARRGTALRAIQHETRARASSRVA